MLEYLELLESASRGGTERFEVDDLIRLISGDLIDRGYRPPDMVVADDIPCVIGNLFVTRELLRRTCILAGAGGNSRLSVEVQSVARMDQNSVPQMHPWTTDELLLLRITGSTVFPDLPAGSDLIAMIRDGLMGPPVEFGLIRHLARLAGGEYLPGPEKGALTFILPLAGERGGA